MKNNLEYLNLYHSQEGMNQRASLMSLVPPDAVIVEIGSHVGVTSDCFVGDGRKIFCIDPWSDESYGPGDGGLIDHNKRLGGWPKVFGTFCKNAGNDLFVNIFPIRCKSEEIAPYFNLPIDLIYVDGDHMHDAVVRDISLWWPKVKIGGYMVFDDYGSPSFGVTQAVDKYFPSAATPFFGHKMIRKSEINGTLSNI